MSAPEHNHTQHNPTLPSSPLQADEDLLVSHQVVSLKDPMSGQRMQVGGAGRQYTQAVHTGGTFRARRGSAVQHLVALGLADH
jgi:hypothetical protein